MGKTDTQQLLNVSGERGGREGEGGGEGGRGREGGREGEGRREGGRKGEGSLIMVQYSSV